MSKATGHVIRCWLGGAESAKPGENNGLLNRVNSRELPGRGVGGPWRHEGLGLVCQAQR